MRREAALALARLVPVAKAQARASGSGPGDQPAVNSSISGRLLVRSTPTRPHRRSAVFCTILHQGRGKPVVPRPT
ncbi:hypothetical protein BV25DRAFT_463963 [Artomyces pyxidatus]|uniref:Uncharacterized protein n=1 Tax=Artomyces pyxidatus TaxID=48021 RepID=A0ACB8T523_9AGAM|nr:hypothetical protein BV25DRAFT_463963 [Artomyces pyxidatus]